MPKVFEQYLEGDNIYTCIRCGTHLTSLSQLVSQHYRSQHGSAFLFNTVYFFTEGRINVLDGEPQRKQMTSGMHTVCDIYCVVCDNGEAIGWKYVKADRNSQKFKEGRFILSEAMLARERWTDY